MDRHGGSSAGSYLTDPTSPIPSHCASIVTTSTLRVKCQKQTPAHGPVSAFTVPGCQRNFHLAPGRTSHRSASHRSAPLRQCRLFCSPAWHTLLRHTVVWQRLTSAAVWWGRCKSTVLLTGTQPGWFDCACKLQQVPLRLLQVGVKQ